MAWYRLRVSRHCLFGGRSLFVDFAFRGEYLFLAGSRDIGEFKSVMLLGIEGFQPYTEYEGEHTESGEEKHRIGVVIHHRVGDSWIG